MKNIFPSSYFKILGSLIQDTPCSSSSTFESSTSGIWDKGFFLCSSASTRKRHNNVSKLGKSMNLKGIICINAKMPWRLSENLGKSRVVKIDPGETSYFFHGVWKSQKVSFYKTASEASYLHFEWRKWSSWRVFELLKLVVKLKQCYQKGQFY